MSNVNIGLDGKAYILTTGTRASWGTLNTSTGCHEGTAPTALSELNIIRGVDLNVDDGEGDASRRASAWKLSKPTQIDGNVDADIPWDPTDSNFILLRNAKFLRKTVAIAFLDGDKGATGSQGPWADWHIFGWKVGQPIDNVQMVKVTFKPAPSAVVPEWVQVTGGTGSGSGG